MEPQSSKNNLVRAGSGGTRRASATIAVPHHRGSIVDDHGRRRSITFEDPANDGEMTGTKDGAALEVAQSSFDKLEQLGPSLMEVLTLKNPPQPMKHQQQNQEQSPGEDNMEGGRPGTASLSSSSSDAALQANAQAKFDVSITRSAILGKVVDPSVDNSRKTQEYFAKMLEKLQCDATGLVLLQDSAAVIFLETTSDQFLLVCKQLMQQKIIEPTSMRVLASCDDISFRILHGLYFKKVVINRPTSDNTNEWNDDTMRQLCVDAFLNLVKFMKKIGPMQPADIRKTLANLSNSDQSILPGNDFVLWLLAQEEIMSVAEFLELYDSPITIELESERVWPVHPLIHY
ncbi:TPA: hypothetical protein N0F65_006555 [Lagenidium giganteum]|uniref:Uncharacterized protein n=1 Tax=Lagenidium giganteum TaxID=4803 RepID=A0AAV2YJX7_9STRA|nr:TPA: hypothetical protein N0F65_006555 [Lagenidium giganteum]